jgi:hypothetical protein
MQDFFGRQTKHISPGPTCNGENAPCTSQLAGRTTGDPPTAVQPTLCRPPPESYVQGLTLVHNSAQREHFLSHVLGCFAGFSDKNGSG